MTASKLTCADYPLAEKRPEIVKGARGKSLDDITLDAVAAGQVELLDLSITTAALHQQAEIAQDAGRATLAQNFERAGDLVDVPQETIMRIYELLRPGRAQSKNELLLAAQDLNENYGAATMAAFIAEAAEVYEARGLFRRRY
jgi:propanediol dehydratase small subunit